MNILDRILKLFGLMRVKRAELIFVELTNLYEKQILEWVYEDFGVPAKSNHEKETREWAVTAFNQAMTNKLDKEWHVLETA